MYILENVYFVKGSHKSGVYFSIPGSFFEEFLESFASQSTCKFRGMIFDIQGTESIKFRF